MTALPSLPVAAVAELAALVALLAGARRDVLTRTIPNWVPGVVAVAGLLLRCLSGDLAPALAAALLIFAGLWALWRFGMLGGGDVKLISACALLVAPGRTPSLLVAIVISGGVLGVAYLLLRRLRVAQVQPVRAAGALSVLRLVRVEAWRSRRGGGVPYGCAIAAGALAVLVGAGSG